jgi:hypothetical protein
MSSPATGWSGMPIDDFANVIFTQLARLDYPAQVTRHDAERVVISVEGFEDLPSKPLNAEGLAALLIRLPDGCPGEEGVDGSVFEVIQTAESLGFVAALNYINEHHG